MIDVALAIVFADSEKNTESRTDSADRLAGDRNFSAGHSLDNGSHDKLAPKVICFFRFCINCILQGYVAVKVDDLTLHRIIYQLTNKISVDNPAEGQEKLPGRSGRASLSM